MGKIINLSLYSKLLVNRCQITFWFSWYVEPNGKQGGQFIYSDTVIEILKEGNIAKRLGKQIHDYIIKTDRD